MDTLELIRFIRTRRGGDINVTADSSVITADSSLTLKVEGSITTIRDAFDRLNAQFTVLYNQ
jgi:acyl-coenzyme A thioesterase PaaI-like protein